MAQVRGRHAAGRKVPKYQVVIKHNSTVRIDDAKNPDFWLEIEFSPDDVDRLIDLTYEEPLDIDALLLDA